MASQSNNHVQEHKTSSIEKEVNNDSIIKTAEDKKGTTKNNDGKQPVENSSPTIDETMTGVKKEEKPKTRFRKGSIFIDVHAANAFYEEKKQ